MVGVKPTFDHLIYVSLQQGIAITILEFVSPTEIYGVPMAMDDSSALAIGTTAMAESWAVDILR